jgi:hypothetical protein
MAREVWLEKAEFVDYVLIHFHSVLGCRLGCIREHGVNGDNDLLESGSYHVGIDPQP